MNYVRNYVLDEAGQPVPEPNLEKWGRWFEESWPARAVARTDLDGGVYVSTVFLGLDHRFSLFLDDAPPILYETMVFEGPWDQSQWRYCTREQATAAHDQIVAAIRAGQDPNESVPYLFPDLDD